MSERSVPENEGRKSELTFSRDLCLYSVIFRHNLHELNSAMLFNKSVELLEHTIARWYVKYGFKKKKKSSIHLDPYRRAWNQACGSSRADFQL